MSKYRYAAYGSNLHPGRLSRRVPSAKLLGTEVAASWKLHFSKRSYRDGSGKCHITRGGRGVRVAVYEIGLPEKSMLDRIEGLGCGYMESTIHVPGYGNCMTYLAESGAIDESLHPFDWYKEIVMLGCRYHRFSPSYTSQIEIVPATTDTDPERSREEWELVRALRDGT